MVLGVRGWGKEVFTLGQLTCNKSLCSLATKSSQDLDASRLTSSLNTGGDLLLNHTRYDYDLINGRSSLDNSFATIQQEIAIE